MPEGGRVAQIELRGVSKRYPGGVEAVAAVDLSVADGALFVIVGPSGSGKSTLLRLIAGLETPDAGSLWIDGRRADGLPPRDRDVAMVFQHPVLYPHLSVFENLAFSLRARKVGREELARRVTAVAEDLGLLELLGRPAPALSGGQRQRVALGRAIVRQPRIFLFDEPLSALDSPLRALARADLMRLHRRLETTTLHVTHDQNEALAMGDQVAVMERGRIVQQGTPREIYDHPRRRFVAEFIGSPPMNFLTCEVTREGGRIRVRIEGIAPEAWWSVPESAPAIAPIRDRPSGKVELGLRPEHLYIMGGGAGRDLVGTIDPPTPLAISAEVLRLEMLGHETIATLGVGPYEWRIRTGVRKSPREGERIMVGLDPAKGTWFDPASGMALGADLVR